jgi:dCTP deaminase
MILSDREIRAALDAGFLKIDPVPPEDLWTSTAVDLTLDATLVRWKEVRPDASGRVDYPRPSGQGFNVRTMANDPDRADQIRIPAGGYPIAPREFLLGYTRQSIYLPTPSRIAARVEGKSSLARLGVGVHVTAPTIHAGFGYNPERPDEPGLPIQLEIFNIGNLTVLLDVGMPICQLILEEVREVPAKGYAGQFSSQKSFTELTP